VEITEHIDALRRQGDLLADAAVAALGSAIPQAAHSALHSPGERTLRRLALAVSITSRAAERS